MKKLTLFLTLTACCFIIYAQVPQGINYQAIARGSDGKEIPNTTIQVKISILSDTTGFYGSGSGTYIWEEQQSVTTNGFGIFTLTVGDPLATKIQGSAPSFNSISWKQQPLFIGTKLNYNGWKNMGTSRLWSVPYSMVAGELEGAVGRLEVIGEDPLSADALFEVKRKDGQTMFAVYNHGTRVYMPLDTLSKARKGGFAIGGFDKAKGTVQDYFVVNSDSIRVYVDNNTGKAKKGGFAIGGFDKAKGAAVPFVDLTPNNYLIGHESGLNTTGLYNSFIGFQSGKANTEGSSNIFIGYQSGFSNNVGSDNTFVGYQAGFSNSGNNAPGVFQHGKWNCYIGYKAGYSSINGDFNTMIGFESGKNNQASLNTFVGYASGSANTEGSYNTFIGVSTAVKNTLGSHNVFMGHMSGYGNVDGENNIYIGGATGAIFKSGNNNIIIGSNAGSGSVYSGEGTGSNNVFIGTEAGKNCQNGFSNVFIGSQAGLNETGSDLLIVENSNSVTPLIYGNFGSNDFRINGNIQYTGTIGTVSDIRFKKNITGLVNVMEKLNVINGIYYEWDQSDTIDLLLQKGRQIGVIAQDVEKVYPELVITTDKGYKMVDYPKLTTVLLEAVKEQQRQIDTYRSETDTLKSMLQELQGRMELIEAMMIKAGEK